MPDETPLVMSKCPNCGNSGMLQADIQPPAVYVVCKKCGREGPKILCAGYDVRASMTANIQPAVKAWNALTPKVAK